MRIQITTEGKIGIGEQDLTVDLVFDTTIEGEQYQLTTEQFTIIKGTFLQTLDRLKEFIHD